MVIIITFLLVTSAIAKAIQDKLQFHFSNSVFKELGSWWNPKTSWKNKWKNGDKKQGEAFPLSSTLLVSLTDAWHLFGLIRDFSIFVCIPIALNNYWLLFLYILYRLTFHVFFTYIFNKK